MTRKPFVPTEYLASSEYREQREDRPRSDEELAGELTAEEREELAASERRLEEARAVYDEAVRNYQKVRAEVDRPAELSFDPSSHLYRTSDEGRTYHQPQVDMHRVRAAQALVEQAAKELQPVQVAHNALGLRISRARPARRYAVQVAAAERERLERVAAATPTTSGLAGIKRLVQQRLGGQR